MFNQDKDRSHVVASNSTACIRCQKPIQQILHNLLLLLPTLDVLGDDVNKSLAVLHILFPNAIASHNNKLIPCGDWELFYIWIASDHLFIVWQILILFVVKVSKWTGKVQTSIHPPHYDLSARFLYPWFFYDGVWLVILRKIDWSSLAAEDTSRVSSIGDEVRFGSNEQNISGASNCWSDKLCFIGLSLIMVLVISDFVECLLSFWTQHDLIDTFEGFIECFLILFLFIELWVLELVLKDSAHIFADFEA